jgi:hypothetical protein
MMTQQMTQHPSVHEAGKTTGTFMGGQRMIDDSSALSLLLRYTGSLQFADC